MDPARTFKESLTSRPELENSQGQKRPSRRAPLDVRITGKSGRCIHLNAVRLRADSVEKVESNAEAKLFLRSVRREYCQ